MRWAELSDDDRFAVVVAFVFAAALLLIAPVTLISLAGGNWLFVGALCLGAILFFAAEVFVPSFGALTLAGLVLLFAGIYESYVVSRLAAALVLVDVGVALSFGLLWAFRAYRKSRIGQIMAPENPQLTDLDRVRHHADLVGRTGVVVTPLRPVGRCSFDGRLVDCASELGFLPAGAAVQAIRTQGACLIVEGVSTA